MKRHLLLLLVALLPMLANAYDAEIDGICYNFSGDEAEVARGYGYYGNMYLVIPESVTYNSKTYRVTSIGNSAFYANNILTSITIPESVISIGTGAFYGCSSLVSVTIGNSVTYIGGRTFDGTPWYDNQPDGLLYIGKVAYKYKGTMPEGTQVVIKEGTLGIAGDAFQNCSDLTSVTIPESVITIGSSAFSGCTGLTAITIPGSVKSLGGGDNDWILENQGVFSGCTNLKAVILGNGVTSIGDYAFYDCNSLTSVTIPNSVTSIGWGAFQECGSLTSINIPESVTYIEGNAFESTPWYENQPDGLIYAGKVAYKYKGMMPEGVQIIITIKEGTTGIADDAFNGCTNLISVTIPESVTNIGGAAFRDCSSLTSITIPNSVTCIENSTLENCSGLTSINIPNSVTSIGYAAFSNCIGLTSISIPENVIKIEDYAFSGCKLRNVLIKCITPPGMDANEGRDGAFSLQTLRHGMLYVPAGCWDAYAFDEEWCYFNNIRETATAEKQVSEQQAYTLMDANTFAYSVYDPVNDCIGTLSVNGIDENNPNHSWQVIDAGGEHYLYNIGAKKFAVATTNGSYKLSNEPTPINLENADNGIILGSQTNKQWALVSNESMSVEQSVITSVNSIPTASQTKGSYYDLEGRQLSTPQKGLNIIRYSNGTRKKVLMK